MRRLREASRRSGVAPLLGRHRVDDRALAADHLLVDVGLGELLLASSGRPAACPSGPPCRPSCCICCSWSAQVVEVEAALGHLLGQLLGLGLVDRLGRLLDQRRRRRPCRGCGRPRASGSNGSRASIFSPMPTNLIGRPVTCAHRQRRAAARIAVGPGQHDAGERQRSWKARGVDRVLAGQRVGDEQGLVRLRERRAPRPPRPSSPRRRAGGRRCRGSATS